MRRTPRARGRPARSPRNAIASTARNPASAGHSRAAHSCTPNASIGGGRQPVLDRRLLEVLEVVQARRHPVAGRRHLARNLGVTSLVRDARRRASSVTNHRSASAATSAHSTATDGAQAARSEGANGGDAENDKRLAETAWKGRASKRSCSRRLPEGAQTMSSGTSTRILPRVTSVPGSAASVGIAPRRLLLRGSLHAVRNPSRLRPPPMPLPAIRIRPAHDDDIADVQQLAGAIWRVHYPGIVSAAQIDYMLARGYASDVLAGFPRPVRSRARARHRRRRAGRFRRVVPARRLERGQARQALRRAVAAAAGPRRAFAGARGGQRARRRRATTLILNVNKRNAQAVRAYEKHGFAIRESVVVDIGEGFVMDDFVMARSI